MRKWVYLFLAGFSGIVQAQNANEQEWNSWANTVKIREATGRPDFIRIKPEIQLPASSAEGLLRVALELDQNEDWQLRKTERDQQGWVHYRYTQNFKGIPVEFAHYYVHTQNGKILSLNGHYIPARGATVPVITRDAARNIAMQTLGGERWKWENPQEEMLLKWESNDPSATWFPNGEVVFAPQNTKFLPHDYRLAWKFDLYAEKPVMREHVYVDAISGEVLFRNPRLYAIDSTGIGVTKYSGNQTIITDFTGTEFRLRETGRGGGVQTFNMNRGTSYAASTDFTDTDNFWDNVNPFADEAATDAHWGAEMTYDYYWTHYGRNSYNNSGAVMRSYIHYDQNYQNAFWDGQRMTYGDGANGNRPFCAMDVSGHEFSHGVVEYTANLVYQDEPGGLNESYADVFGTAIEFFGKPSQANWLIGENIGAFRSLSDPKQYSNPDTYQGTFWVSPGGFDNGGVHFNSGVQNHFFYLLSVGGSGTNDNGDVYSVTGIGIDSAAAVAYRCLSVYLGPTSQYADAGFYSVESSIDLFGECSQQMISTMNAWYAVGVGRPFGPLSADFIISEGSHCTAPATVQFTNLSVGALSYRWEFGDGTTSNVLNPSHTYSFFGTYSPRLIVTGCNGEKDTLAFQDIIVINSSQLCTTNMPAIGSGSTLTACEGRLLDSGGNGDYLPNVNSSQLIEPAGAASLQLTFTSFAYANGGDYIAIYDGNSTAAPLIGYFNGTNLPNGGTIQSSGPSLFIVERTNGNQEFAGFEATWSCATAIDHADLQQFSVFPNPASDRLVIRFEGMEQGEGTLQLKDALGRSVISRRINPVVDREVVFDVANLPSGIYFTEFYRGSQRLVSRVVIQ